MPKYDLGDMKAAQKRNVTVELQASEYAALNRLAAKQKSKLAPLLREWIREKLEAAGEDYDE